MKPIFTIHAGEYLVAAEIEKSFKDIIVWLPSKDTGIDLLLTDKTNKKTATLQVKFSKDFNVTHAKEHLRPHIKGTGWWKFNREKIKTSQADFWVFILYSFAKKSHDFIIIKPSRLLEIFNGLNRNDKSIHSYITVTENSKAFETRELPRSTLQLLLNNKKKIPERDLSDYLNNWTLIKKQLK